MSHLPERAGSGSLANNLTEAALSIAPTALLLIDMVHARPPIAARMVVDSRHSHPGGLEEIERWFATYLDAERALGRVIADADTGAIALALAASVHRLALSYGPDDPELPRQIRRTVTALVAGLSREPIP